MPAMAQENHTESEDEHEESGAIEMDAAQRQKNGVETARISMQTLGDEITAPGEVVLNQYKTAHVTPRISGQITRRHAKLGQHVKRGAPLVTLTSVQLAEAQGNAIVAAQEWQRVKALGTDVVSKRRYNEAQIAAQLSEAKITSYGMTPKSVTNLLAGGDASKATGTFTLYASQSGTVMKDAFVMGEIIDPGRELFVISDESKAWVTVNLSHESAEHVEIGTPIRFKTGSGNRESDWKNGKVLQLGHRIDETTRTLSVRAQMDNAGDSLHAGQFVTAYIQTGSDHKVLAAPIDAVTFMEGQNIVFVVEGDELHPTPVKLGAKRGGWVEIKSGVNTDTEIATTQIFLLKSLILKSKMGEGHGH
jgi:cobalt-zinc-cadmium efflux system membrane fusion protein